MPVSEGARGFEKIPEFILGSAIARYVFASQFAHGEVVVDISCGCACGTNILARNSLLTIAADILREPLNYAKKHYGGNKLDFIRLNAEQLPFRTNSIDIIVSHDLLEHLDRWEEFLNECQRVLKHDGILICSTPNAEISSSGSRPIHPSHIKEFCVEELRNLLLERFKEVSIYGTDPQSRLDKSIYHLVVRILPRLPSLLPLRLERWLFELISFVTRLVWRRYQWVKLKNIDLMSHAELQKYLSKHLPYLLGNSSPPPQHLIGIATHSKPAFSIR